MKKLKHLLLTLLLVPLITNAQVRPDIYSFSPAERTLLFDSMIAYITVETIEQHCNYTSLTQNSSLDIHSDFDFLPFHRVYIEQMEDYLISVGLDQFVPLPSWNPDTIAPFEFIIGGANGNGIDPDCWGTTCNDPSPSLPVNHCANIINWDPQKDRPDYLINQQNTGSYNDLCDWPFSPITPGGTDNSGLSRIIEGDPSILPSGSNYSYHNLVHVLMNGNMITYASPSAPIFWIWHAYVDDIWKEWEEYCTNQISNTSNPIDLYVKDNYNVMESYRDRGEEPSLFSPFSSTDFGANESPDIWCRNQTDGIANQTHENPVIFGDPVYIYVRVRNRGYNSSLGTEQLNLYWGNNDLTTTEAHWDNSNNDGFGGLVTPSQIIPITDAQDQSILTFTWYPPNPANFQNSGTPTEFGLMAVIDDGNSTFPFLVEEDYVYNNNNVAMKGVTLPYPCATTVTNVIPNNATSSSTSLVGGDIEISGNFTIDNNFSISGRSIYMNPGAKIDFDNNSSLDLLNVEIKACPNSTVLWNEIELDNPSEHLIMDECSLSDAEIGVHSIGGGNYTISNSTFKNNEGHIKAELFQNQTHNGSIHSSVFENDGSGIALTTYTAIDIYKVGTISIGDPSNGLNIIKDADYGIRTFNSNTTIQNNAISDINFNGNITTSGDAIKGNQWGNTLYLLTVGGSNAGESNTMENCRRGIYANGNKLKVHAEQNSISNMSSAGIFLNKCQEIDIIENTIHDYTSFGIYSTKVNSAYINMSENTIDNGVFGINIQNPVPNYPNTTISNNEITNVRLGIKFNITKSPTLISNNQIYFSQTPTLLGMGIKIIQCNNSDIIDNYIEDIYPTSPSTNGYGVVADNCENSNFIANKMVGSRRGLQFTNNYTDVAIECNRFEHCETGVWFNGTVTNNPLQIGSPTQASDNVWTLNTVPVEVDGASWGNQGVVIDWYVRTITATSLEYDPSLNSIPSLGFGTINPIYGTPINNSCTSPARLSLTFDGDYKIFPNPADDYFVLELGNVAEDAILSLHDMQGKKVLQNSIKANTENRFDTRKLRNGLYNYTLQIGDKQKVGKLIISK